MTANQIQTQEIHVIVDDNNNKNANSVIHHPYAFHVSGPRKVSAPNWRDLINSSWLVYLYISLNL